MDNQKATENTGASSGEIPERANSKTEKTHQKITLPTFEKRGKQEAKLRGRQITQYIEMTQNIDLNVITTTAKYYKTTGTICNTGSKVCSFGHWASQQKRRRQEQLGTMTQIDRTLTNYIRCSGCILYRNETNSTVEQTSLG